MSEVRQVKFLRPEFSSEHCKMLEQLNRSLELIHQRQREWSLADPENGSAVYARAEECVVNAICSLASPSIKLEMPEGNPK